MRRPIKRHRQHYFKRLGNSNLQAVPKEAYRTGETQIMTEAEAREFFEAVRGRPIRWTTWSKEVYFVPSRLENSYLWGRHYNDDYPSGCSHIWEINNGFEPYVTNRWQFVDPADAPKPEPTCNCNCCLVPACTCTCCPVHGRIEKAFSNEKGVAT